MNRQVIPGRHHFSVFGFGGIERRADVGIRALKDHQCLSTSQRLPLRIGFGQVTEQRAIGPLPRIEQQRHVVRLQARFVKGDQGRQARAFNLPVQAGEILIFEIAGCVHEIFLGD